MITDTFSIKYQLVPHGTEETKIQFYNTIPEIFENLIQNNEQTVICTDSNVVNIPEVKTFLNKINNANVETVIIPAGEENKTLESVLSIIKAALDKSFTRNCKFIAIGGGVGDLPCRIDRFFATFFYEFANLINPVGGLVISEGSTRDVADR